jgi:hypothetical protein
MECSHCLKTFTTIYSLEYHKKTTKKCLAIQRGEKITNDCEYCLKVLSSKRTLLYHYKTCKTKLEQDNKKKILQKQHEVNEYEEKMETLASDFRNHKEEMEYELKRTKEQLQEHLHIELQKKDEEINKLREQLKAPHVTKKTKINMENNIENNIETNIEQQNNITIYNIMSPEHVETFFNKHYNLDTLLGGQKALARFVNDGFLKEMDVPLYLCGDRSRQKFYIVKDGKKMEDPNCEEIIGLTSAGLPRVQEVFENALFSDLPEKVTEDDVQDNYQHIMNIEEQRTDFKSELSKIVSSDDTPVSKPNIKEMVRALKARSEKLGLLERQPKKDSKEVESIEPILRPNILGIPPGKLMVYRDRYRKDGMVKGPKDIMEKIKLDPEAHKEYMTYLQS